MLCVYTLVHRELVRFFRQRSRVIGALGQPIIFWLLFGAGLSGSFSRQSGGGVGYMEYFVPGVAAMILLFTAIFSTISIIEDRKEGFLQSVLVAPVSRGTLVLGKILGGTLLAVIQGVIFLMLAPTQEGISLNGENVLGLLGVMFLVAFALTGLGFTIAWRSDSTQGYHAIMSVFLFPMWLLSGAFFPITESTPVWLSIIVAINPLTYGVKLLRWALYLGTPSAQSLENSTACRDLTITLVFAAAMFLASRWICAKRVAGDLK